MLNAIPVIGWMISAIASLSLAIPFWFFWSYFDVGETYFGFLPCEWQSIPFHDCVGIFICISIIKAVFIPKLATVNQNNNIAD